MSVLKELRPQDDWDRARIIRLLKCVCGLGPAEALLDVATHADTTNRPDSQARRKQNAGQGKRKRSQLPPAVSLEHPLLTKLNIMFTAQEEMFIALLLWSK